jgi:hypothetical protein
MGIIYIQVPLTGVIVRKGRVLAVCSFRNSDTTEARREWEKKKKKRWAKKKKKRTKVGRQRDEGAWTSQGKVTELKKMNRDLSFSSSSFFICACGCDCECDVGSSFLFVVLSIHWRLWFIFPLPHTLFLNKKATRPLCLQLALIPTLTGYLPRFFFLPFANPQNSWL